MKSEIAELDKNLRTLRDLLNVPKIHGELYDNKEVFEQVFCALDSLGDGLLAIKAYNNLVELIEVGLLYLYVYGVLQVIYVQQDCIRVIANRSGVVPNTVSKMKDLREIRNKTVGHPATYKRSNMLQPFSVQRVSLSLDKFRMYRFSVQDYYSEEVDIKTLLVEHLRLLNGDVEKVISDCLKEQK